MKQKPKAWSDVENEYIIRNFGEVTYQQMADTLGRSYHSVQAQARKLNLRQYAHKEWTEEEQKFMIENYPTTSAKYCGEQLGRSEQAVLKFAQKLGVKREWKYWYISKEGYRVLCHDRENKVLEHRAVMEKKLGRKLTSEEIVHHIDGNKLNNHPDNLVLTNRSEHIDMHREEIQDAWYKSLENKI